MGNRAFCMEMHAFKRRSYGKYESTLLTLTKNKRSDKMSQAWKASMSF